MERIPYCDKFGLKRGLWTVEEDAKILAYVSKHGTSNWTCAPKKAGLKRCGKSCRLRWTNYLRPDLKHHNFTPQEEELIIRLHAAIGSRWSIIAQQLPGRTDNDVKNYWNTKLRKKLTQMGIDPVTHKPFSQILADYGNIGGFSRSTKRIGSLSRDLKTAAFMKQEHHQTSAPRPFRGIDVDLSTPTMLLSETEPAVLDEFMNGDVHQFNNNNSLNLLIQLQAMQLMTETSHYTYNIQPIQPHFYVQDSLPSSPASSSSTAPACCRNSSSIFSWKDFLLDDAFLPSEPRELENMADFSLNQNGYHTQKGVSNEEMNKIYDYQYNKFEGMDCLDEKNETEGSSVSGESTFIETLLNQDDKIFFELNLLEEPLCY